MSTTHDSGRPALPEGFTFEDPPPKRRPGPANKYRALMDHPGRWVRLPIKPTGTSRTAAWVRFQLGGRWEAAGRGGAAYLRYLGPDPDPCPDCGGARYLDNDGHAVHEANGWDTCPPSGEAGR